MRLDVPQLCCQLPGGTHGPSPHGHLPSCSWCCNVCGGGGAARAAGNPASPVWRGFALGDFYVKKGILLE